MRRVRTPVLLLALGLAACATPSQRIATRLVDLGVPPAQARCMGAKLQDRLSIAQLRRLDTLSGLDRQKLGRMSIAEIAGRLADPGDMLIAAEFVRAGVGCA